MHLDGIDGPRPRPGELRIEDLGVYEAHGGHTLRRHVYTPPGDEVRRIDIEGVAAAGRFLNRPPRSAACTRRSTAAAPRCARGSPDVTGECRTASWRTWGGSSGRRT